MPQFVKNISEIVLMVKNVRRSAKFYQEVVGLIPETKPDNDWAWFWAGRPRQSARLALHKGELLFEAHSPLPKGKRWGSIHYAFHVPKKKLAAALKNLRVKGILVYGPKYFHWMKASGHYFFDPDGNLIEFWTPEKTEKAKI